MKRIRACVFLSLLASLCCATGIAADESSQQTPTFVSSTACSDCHSRIYPPGVESNWDGMRITHHGGEPTPVDPAASGPYSLWSGTMMAHAARDPYWLAKVRFEARNTPAAAAEIEDACLRCHAPAQQYSYRDSGRPMRLEALQGLGREGVTCTVCHQISPEGLGETASFTAGFTINIEDHIYGPHADPFPMPMRMHTGKTPSESAHMLESALCGSCHTVITPTLDIRGEESGRFLEQATYLEWKASDFPERGETCQSCHMPLLEGADGQPVKQFIAHTPHGGFFGPTQPRQPFAQHTFQGANTQMFSMLAELIPSRGAVLKQAAERARENLRGALELGVQAQETSGELRATVRLRNRSGHKLPSGFPSRRLWLRVVVTDQNRRTIFESGAFDPTTGELVHAPEQISLHRNIVLDPKQTQVYEAVPADATGLRTASLMRASSWAKDNRLLPAGFRGDAALPEGVRDLSIEPAGVEGDPNFGPGGDEIEYRIATADEHGPYHVRVEALFQTMHAEPLTGMDAGGSQEEERFLAVRRRHTSPTLIATAETEVRE